MTDRTEFPTDIPPDPGLLDLMELVIMNEEHLTLPRCGALIRRAKAIGWLRDRTDTAATRELADDARTLVPTDEGTAVYRRWRRA